MGFPTDETLADCWRWWPRLLGPCWPPENTNWWALWMMRCQACSVSEIFRYLTHLHTDPLRLYVDAAIVAIGNNCLRKELHQMLYVAGFELAMVIHLKAVVSLRAVVGAGCAITAGAIVGTEAQLGANVIVDYGAVVDRHCRIEDFSHLGTNAGMAGGSVLERGAWMQAGAVLGYGVKLETGVVWRPA